MPVLTTALITGGVAAAVPLAVRGVTALLPASREARKAAKEEREKAAAAVQRGEKFGFGPSRAKRERQVAQGLKDFNKTMAAPVDDLRRQEAALGFGRAGLLAGARQRIAKAGADAAGKIRGAVEERSEAIAERKEAAARNRLRMAQAALDRRAAEQRQFFTDTAIGAVQTGVSAGMGKKAQMEASTRGTTELASMIAATQGAAAADEFLAFNQKLQAEAAEATRPKFPLFSRDKAADTSTTVEAG